MKLQVGWARGISKIKDLKPGTLFRYQDKIALRTDKDHFSFEHCNCIVVGTGKELFDYTIDEETFNNTYVTIILLYGTPE